MKKFTPTQLSISKQIDGNKLNVFNSLSDSYNINETPIMISFMEDISNQFSDDDVFLVTTVGETQTTLTTLTIKEAKQRIEEFRFSPIPFTVGIIKKDFK
jgi:hypothetical protein